MNEELYEEIINSFDDMFQRIAFYAGIVLALKSPNLAALVVAQFEERLREASGGASVELIEEQVHGAAETLVAAYRRTLT